MNNFLNKAMVLRLAKYFRVLQQLKALGFVNVFSNNLGDAIGVAPAVVRKDFSLINLPGNKRGGYNIDSLIGQLSVVLGKNRPHEVVLAGCGRIGTALMEYKEFAREGIRIIAGFDTDPAKVKTSSHIPIYDISELPSYARANNVQIGILAVPDAAASEVLRLMIEAGILGVFNFAPVELKGNGKCVIHTVNIGLEIENLFYLVTMAEQQMKEPGVQGGAL